MRGFLGFGAALVIVPTLSFALPPVVAVTILVIIEIPTILYLVPTSIRDSNLKDRYSNADWYSYGGACGHSCSNWG